MELKQAKELVRGRLSDKRYEHTINVKKMAVKLAKHYGTDPEQAALAALLHDAAKELPKDEMRAIMQAYPQYAQGGEAPAPPFWRVRSGASQTKPCSAPSPAIPQARRA